MAHGRRVAPLGLLLALSGCTLPIASPVASPSPTQTNVCQIFSQDEIRSVMGGELGPPRAVNIQDDPHAPNCDVPTLDGTGSLNISIERGMTLDGARSSFQRNPTNTNPPSSPNPVPGIGDEAAVVVDNNGPEGQPQGIIGLRKGGVLALISVANSKPPATERTLKDLARKLLVRTDLANVHT